MNNPVNVQNLYEYEFKKKMVNEDAMQREAIELYLSIKARGVKKTKILFCEGEQKYEVPAASFYERARAWAGVWVCLVFRFDLNDDRLRKHFGLEETIPNILHDVNVLYEILNDCPLEKLKITNMMEIMESYLNQNQK